MNNRPVRLTILLIMSALLFTMICCDRHGKAWDKMNLAEQLMQSRPDSALHILNDISNSDLNGKKEFARYALLKSMALDKNYIDTTTFDVLQPAIDYYLEKGSADDRLRTLYYQGRIFMNKSDFDMAMQCFLQAEDLKNSCSDSLTYANLLVAQGNLYYKSYQIDDYTQNNLRAANLYYKLRNESARQFSLIRALDGYITSNNLHKADSIMAITDSLVRKVPESQEMHALVKLTYGIVFDSNEATKSTLYTISNLKDLNDETKLNISLGYVSLNEPEKANDIFALIDTTGEIAQSIRYLYAKSYILEANKKYGEAILALKKYQIATDAENSSIYSQKTTVAQGLHELKVNHLNSLRHKDRQIWLGLCLVLVLIIIIGVIYYQLRINKKNRIISEQEQSRLQLENENLQKNNSLLELEKRNAELACDKQKLAAENMRLRIAELESEGEHLKELLTKSQLSKPILESIQERIEILNGLLAAKISDNDTYLKPYDKWINQVTEDRKSFMDSTRLAFRVSHPEFMKFLEDHGLTESELNYVCLYAIGLRGKEIGEYIQIKRHYHTSSDIRKKLGLNEQDTNLGLHIRRLMKNL